MKFKFISLLFKDVIEFKVKIPIWILFWLVLTPLVAYGDYVSFSKTSFGNYLIICFIELFLMFLGYTIGVNKKIKKEKEKN